MPSRHSGQRVVSFQRATTPWSSPPTSDTLAATAPPDASTRRLPGGNFGDGRAARERRVNARWPSTWAASRANASLRCHQAVHGTEAPRSFCPHTRTIAAGRHAVELHEPPGRRVRRDHHPLLGTDGRLASAVHVARDIPERNASGYLSSPSCSRRAGGSATRHRTAQAQPACASWSRAARPPPCPRGPSPA